MNITNISPPLNLEPVHLEIVNRTPPASPSKRHVLSPKKRAREEKSEIMPTRSWQDFNMHYHWQKYTRLIVDTNLQQQKSLKCLSFENFKVVFLSPGQPRRIEGELIFPTRQGPFQITHEIIHEGKYGTVCHAINLSKPQLAIFKFMMMTSTPSAENQASEVKHLRQLRNEHTLLNKINPFSNVPGIQIPPSDFITLNFTDSVKGVSKREGYFASYYPHNYIQHIYPCSADLVPLITKIYEFIQLLFGLKYIASIEMIHQDIKPQNILVKQDDSHSEILVHLADWAGATKLHSKLSYADLNKIFKEGPYTTHYTPVEDEKDRTKLLLSLQRIEKELVVLQEELADEKLEEKIWAEKNLKKIELSAYLESLKKDVFTIAYKTDVYAMGVTLFVGFSGLFPYDFYKIGKNKNRPRHNNPNSPIRTLKDFVCPEKLKTLFKKMLSPLWKDRPTADEAYVRVGEIIQENQELSALKPQFENLNQLFAVLPKFN